MIQPRRERRDDTFVSALIIVVAVVLLVTPISLGALVDIVRYLQGPGQVSSLGMVAAP